MPAQFLNSVLVPIGQIVGAAAQGVRTGHVPDLTPRQHRRAYDQHVAGYIVKTDLEPDFALLTTVLGSYNESVRLPRHALHF